MKKGLVSISLGFALACSTAAYAADDMSNMTMSGAAKQGGDAQGGMSHGEIRKIDTANGKLTIKHGPLDNLGMGAMTMVFAVKDPAMLSQVKVGDQIDFVADRVDGTLTVAKLQKQ